MAKRSYHQLCGLAVALDVVAERWALLVVRDLAPGPRRFTDLLAGLPGIATDMLAERLRALEAAGAVRQRQVKHPAPAKVYELTDRGRELADITAALAAWGMPLLPPPGTEGYRVSPRWALQSMAHHHDGRLAPGAYHLTVDDEELSVVVEDDGTARVAYGHVGEHPHLALRCDGAAFFALAMSRGDATVDVEVTAGRPAGVRRLFRSLPLPAPQAPALSPA